MWSWRIQLNWKKSIGGFKNTHRSGRRKKSVSSNIGIWNYSEKQEKWRVEKVWGAYGTQSIGQTNTLFGEKEAESWSEEIMAENLLIAGKEMDIQFQEA